MGCVCVCVCVCARARLSVCVCANERVSTLRAARDSVMGLSLLCTCWTLSRRTQKADRGLRPGVSVTLEGMFSKGCDNHGRELLVPGRTLVMRVAVPKIGTAVAFASADVSVDGFPVAQLSHIKYMPLRGFLGVAWAAAFSPPGRWLTEQFGKGAVLSAITQRMPKDPTPLADDVGKLIELEDVRPDPAGAHALTAAFGPMRAEHTNPLVSWEYGDDGASSRKRPLTQCITPRLHVTLIPRGHTG